MTREEELEALFPKMAILTSKSLTASSPLYSMHWTFLTIDDPLWGSNIFFSEGVLSSSSSHFEAKIPHNIFLEYF